MASRIPALLLLILLVSCSAPAVKTTVLMPARFHEATTLKEVAVLPFDGQGGNEFAAEIESILMSVNIGDKQYFTLVDRTRIDKIISELKLGQSALVETETAVKIGKLLGAKGIYTGVIGMMNVSDNHYSESRSRCAQYATQPGKKYTYCARYESYNVPCTKRTAVFSATPKLIEVQTGRVVYANSISGTANSSACKDSSKPLLDKAILFANAKEAAKAIFKSDVAPHYVTQEIKIMDSKDGLTSNVAEKKFEQGIDFAKNNRLDRACELWGEVRTISPNSPSLLYNLGICSEVVGNLDEALDLYKKADRLLNKPDDKISAALGRVTQAIQNREKIKQQTVK